MANCEVAMVMSGPRMISETAAAACMRASSVRMALT
jgi:hypothetical protein